MEEVTANTAALFYLFEHILLLILMLCINSCIICPLITGSFKTHYKLQKKRDLHRKSLWNFVFPPFSNTQCTQQKANMVHVNQTSFDLTCQYFSKTFM